MKIERIVRKNSRDIIVKLDSGKDLFLAREVLLKNGLRKNDDLSEEAVSSLIEENKKYYIKQAAFRYLGKRIHSTGELRIKLKQKKYEPHLIDSVISELKKNNYLDDNEFASRFSEEKIRTKSWGRLKIESELRKRGIAGEIISEALENKFGGSEIDKAKELAKKKLKSLNGRGLEENKIKEKLFSFLYSRGYDYETIRETVDLLFRES
ncbi:MAG TPA: regulatory protein RecX [Ignavibacteriaceae bacterium]|nr:regulatory protein RecX [Ignavibacteriaceae bacterium]